MIVYICSIHQLLRDLETEMMSRSLLAKTILKEFLFLARLMKVRAEYWGLRTRFLMFASDIVRERENKKTTNIKTGLRRQRQLNGCWSSWIVQRNADLILGRNNRNK